ncbi:MAG: hypothetical protein LBH00_09825 [Planctomycetaceae bacterium]|jgi:hypothetical protein|nr:hypothetical protein [Planctomycetaceae bacterium]
MAVSFNTDITEREWKNRCHCIRITAKNNLRFGKCLTGKEKGRLLPAEAERTAVLLPFAGKYRQGPKHRQSYTVTVGHAVPVLHAFLHAFLVLFTDFFDAFFEDFFDAFFEDFFDDFFTDFLAAFLAAFFDAFFGIVNSPGNGGERQNKSNNVLSRNSEASVTATDNNLAERVIPDRRKKKPAKFILQREQFCMSNRADHHFVRSRQLRRFLSTFHRRSNLILR